MHIFSIGDWVYAGDYVYGQIVELGDDWAAVEFDTGSGGGTLTYDISILSKAEPPTKIHDLPQYHFDRSDWYGRV